MTPFLPRRDVELHRRGLQRIGPKCFCHYPPAGTSRRTNRSMGFCIFNNIAIAARDALANGIKRVAIVDYDAHHGNGTQAAFVDDERVAYCSTHQWGIYPGTGWYEQRRTPKRKSSMCRCLLVRAIKPTNELQMKSLCHSFSPLSRK